MKAEGYNITHVYTVNDVMVVADTMAKAIELYELRFPDVEPRECRQIGIGNVKKDYDAMIEQ